MLERIRQWLNKKAAPPCSHRWTILLEYYPSFTKDRWQCKKCGKAETFPHDEPPVKLKEQLCNLGHLHIMNR